MAATIRRSSQNSNVYGAYGIVGSDKMHIGRTLSKSFVRQYRWR